jgi:putative SOS response-associated peptidase YedK
MRPAATPFALAGVYDVWKGRNGQVLTSFAMVMTDAAPSVAEFHNRMPLVLDNAQFDDWMRGAPEQAAAALGTSLGLLSRPECPSP